MNKNIKLLFLLILLLPTVIFSLYEMGSYRENERVIETIYGNQLESILYSVNQYSDDVIGSWASKIHQILNDKHHPIEEEMQRFTQGTPSILFLNQYDLSLTPVRPVSVDAELDQEIRTILGKNTSALERLTTYLEADYRKIASYRLKNQAMQLLVFLCKANGEVVINAIVLRPDRFIQEILDPKIQEISQDKFYIGAFYKTDRNIFYNSDKQYSPKKFEYSKPIWFFDDYFLGIELQNQTIRELVQSRARKNIYLMLVVDLVLLFGGWLINRNLRKQMELAKIKSDFISNVSHEIRTPLALISMYVETLELNRVNSEEERKDYFSIITQETRRLSNMVNHILDFSHMESGKQTYQFLPTNLNDLVGEVVQMFQVKLDAERFKLELSFDEHLPDLLIDRDSMTNVLVNLLDNALKYSGENKFIHIRTCFEKSFVTLEIEDCGIGISDFDQKRIFDKFYRVTKKNLAQKTKGSGLGLTLVKLVMDAHKGRVEVKSSLGQGSSFKLIFPVTSN